MSIDTPLNRVDYVGNGNTSVYTYNFKIFHNSNLRVIKRDASGTETQLFLNADYEVEGAGDPTGGTIRLINGALPSGVTLTIRRVVDAVQETDFRNQAELYPEVIEDALDYQAMISQGQQDDIGRAVKLPETLASNFNPSLPASIKLKAGKTIVINNNATGFDFGPSTLDIEGYVEAANLAKAEAKSAEANALTYKNLTEGFKASAEQAAIDSDIARDEAQAAQAAAYVHQNNAQAAEASAINNAAQALQSKHEAITANTQAQAAKDFAQAWATKMGDSVDGVEFSAKHYAENAQAYRVKFFNNNQLVGFATEVNFSADLKATVTPAGRINLDVESITYLPAPYSFILTAAQVAAGELSLPQVPPYPNWVRLVPEGGIEQVNGIDYEVVVNNGSAKLVWRGFGLDNVLEENERILLIY